MTRKPSKAIQAAQRFFQVEVWRLLEERGAVPRHDGGGFVLPSPVGDLHVDVYENWIACRAQNIEALAEWRGERNGNGKWNQHYTDDVTTLKAAPVYFIVELDNLLEFQPDPAFWQRVREQLAEREVQWPPRCRDAERTGLAPGWCAAVAKMTLRVEPLDDRIKELIGRRKKLAGFDYALFGIVRGGKVAYAAESLEYLRSRMQRGQLLVEIASQRVVAEWSPPETPQPILPKRGTPEPAQEAVAAA